MNSLALMLRSKYLMPMVAKLIPHLSLLITLGLIFSVIAQNTYAADNIVLLYTAKPADTAEEYDDLSKVAEFAIEQYDQKNLTKTQLKVITLDDKDSPEHALKSLKKIVADKKPVAVVGPLYSNVALGLKDFINETQTPMVSIFSTHNDLTKNSQYVFRICASNRRLVKSMADFLIPEAKKLKLNIITFKDLTDDYSIDLADTFRHSIEGVNVNHNEVLFKGVKGLDRLRDLNSKLWNPTKKDILFIPTRDIVAARLLAALETAPNMVAAIDTVDFKGLMKRVKSQQSHIRIVTTSQWLPQKSEFSKEIEETYSKKFKKGMNITTALTFDATYATVAAYHRSQVKKIKLAQALRDSTKVQGVSGLILLGADGERIFSDQFLKEEFVE